MKQSIQYGITLLFGIMLLCTQAVWAQGQVTGTVNDENSRKYHINFIQNILLRGVIKQLEEKGFTPTQY